MIAPTNCNPYCDCAQRSIRCQKAPPPFVIPASLGVAPLDYSKFEVPIQASEWGRTDLRNRIVSAFQDSEFDLADWDFDVLCELADIAIAALEKA